MLLHDLRLLLAGFQLLFELAAHPVLKVKLFVGDVFERMQVCRKE